MSWQGIKKMIMSRPALRLREQTGVALALEAGTAFLKSQRTPLASRVALVSIKNGVLHAIATSAPAAYELAAVRDSLFSAMRREADVVLHDLRIDIRGSLAPQEPL